VIHALERAAQLMAQVGGGRVVSGRLDEYPHPIYRPRLCLRVSRTNQVLGTAYSQEQISRFLRRLHLPVVAQDTEVLEVEVPSHRGDLEREIDLIEEVARLGGYEAIPVTLPQGVVATRRPGPEVRLRHEAKQLLVGLGFSEVTTYSFQPERLGALQGEEESRGVLRLANPLSEEQALMRTSLLPGLLDTLRRNLLKQIQDARLFELSKIFIPEAGADLPREEQRLAGVLYGAREEASWLAPREPFNFFGLKGVVETLLEGLLIPEVSFQKEGLPQWLREGARVFSQDLDLGVLGELQAEIAEKLDLEGPIFVFDLNFDALSRAAQPFPLFTPLPRYPGVYRDIALVLLETVPAARVAKRLYHHGSPLLVEAQLFDVYTGDPIPPGKRSLAFRLCYRDPERTLTDEIVNRKHEVLVQALKKELGAELR
jgi:phenylalanyl-tRNA synthetase beta chain